MCNTVPEMNLAKTSCLLEGNYPIEPIFESSLIIFYARNMHKSICNVQQIHIRTT